MSRVTYTSSIEEVANLILVLGTKRTVLVEGDMGSGKSSILTMLAEVLSGYTICYLDAAVLSTGDVSIPNVMAIDHDGNHIPYVTFAPNENFGIHKGKPVILMIDEIGKAGNSTKNSLLRVCHPENGVRHVGNYPLPEGSIVFATTNKGAEGVGDLFLPHQNDRFTIVQMRKSNAVEQIEYGINNEWESSVLGFIKEFPQILQSFEDVDNPSDNPYIFHPKEMRRKFITPRGLEAASDILKSRADLDTTTITNALMGTLGERGALDLMAFVQLADQLPTLESIKNDPANALVPTSAGAVCMVVYRSLAMIDRSWINAWMDYMVRLDAEAQGMFANGVRTANYKHQTIVLTNKKFTDWSLANTHMYTADKV
tara:strand:- start:1026 stop:2135 length:1110 start_codon:yes stop_codon:yes gene_type:complete